MRQDVPPKHIRVKDEPEIATTRTFGGVGTVLYSGAVSEDYAIGDNNFTVRSIEFNNLDADYLVRLQYQAHGAFTAPVNLRFALDLDDQNPLEGVSAYSDFDIEAFGWEVLTTTTIAIAGTAIIPAGTHTVSPWWDVTLDSTNGSAAGNQDPTFVREYWMVDIIDKASNDAFGVNYSGFPSKDLGESFQWVTFEQGNT